MIGVLASGEGTNLQALIDAGLPIAAVASDTPGARALEHARTAGIPSAVFELPQSSDRVRPVTDVRGSHDQAMADWLDARGVRLVVLAGYLRLLSPAFLERFDPIVNVHPSLLPEFPGLRAIERAVEAGVTETGVTVHLVDEGVDTGPVLRQEPVPVEPQATLVERIHEVEHRLLPEVVRELCLAR
jgi:phosphoribosylglycinamide formyltransferase-1